MLSVYVYGSGECDQIEPETFESKNPHSISLFNTEPSNKVYKIACGGMHTLVLTTMGTVYSWGCNDDSALGREGTDGLPALVEGITMPVNHIVAGDSHSVAYNTELNAIYLWGEYRVNFV
jgi:regulator of chromosome condensation